MPTHLLNMDCMEFMKDCADNSFDLAIVDPPYGIDINNSGTWMKAHDLKIWDREKPVEEYFSELKRVSINVIIWGGNYFTDVLPPNNNWIVWHKMNDGMSFSMCELAYSTIRKNIKLFTLMNNGVKKIHPTQKPVSLYKWLLNNYAEPNQTILDTHLGSGSSAIAAHYFGCDFTGIEIDKDYFEAAQKRFAHETRQISMF